LNSFRSFYKWIKPCDVKQICVTSHQIYVTSRDYYNLKVLDFDVLTMDAESTINATGKGQLKGKGYYMSMGASYAGQGGTQDSDGVDRTYGTFF
jgi:hypothetical protein